MYKNFFCQELEAERQARCKAEKQRGTLARELDDLGDRLEVNSFHGMGKSVLLTFDRRPVGQPLLSWS